MVLWMTVVRSGAGFILLTMITIGEDCPRRLVQLFHHGGYGVVGDEGLCAPAGQD